MPYNEVNPSNSANVYIPHHDVNVIEINSPLSNNVSSISTSRETFLGEGSDIFSVENNYIKREVFHKYTQDFHNRVYKEVIDPIIKSDAIQIPESKVSSRLIESTEKSAIEELLKLTVPSDAAALKEKLENAESAALFGLTNMAMTIQALDGVVGFKDLVKQYREELIKLIEGDKLDHHSGFTAFHERNNYKCVKNLEKKLKNRVT